MNPFDIYETLFRGSPNVGAHYVNNKRVGDLEWQGMAGAACLVLQLLAASYVSGYTGTNPYRYVYDHLVAMEVTYGRNEVIDYIKQTIHREAHV